MSFSAYYTKISISFLKSVFSEIQSQDMCSSGFPSKTKTGLWLTDLSGLTIRGLLFWRETTLKTHVLTQISEKIDFSNKPDLSCLILQIDDDLSHFLLCYFRYYLGLKLLVLWWHIWQLFAQLVMKVLESPISALLQYDLYYVSMTQNFFVGFLICGKRK